jgi:putative transposase
MKPIEITRTEYMADEMWTLYKKERDGRMKERYHAIAMMLEGRNARETADALHLSRNTTWEWAIAYNDEGLEGLKRDSPPGRTPRLTNDEKELLKADLLKNPRELGYDFSRWDGKSISHHIDRCFNKHLSVRGVQEMVKKMGFTLQRANVKQVKADPALQEKFKADLKKK